MRAGLILGGGQDAVRGSLKCQVCSTSQRWPPVCRDRDKALVSFASAAAKAALGLGLKDIYAFDHVRARRSNDRANIVGIGGKRTIKKKPRACDVVSRV